VIEEKIRSVFKTFRPGEPVKKVQRALLLKEVLNIIVKEMLIKFVRFQNQN